MIGRARIASLGHSLTQSFSVHAAHSKVLYHQKSAHVLEVVLNNEKSLNSLDSEMIASLTSQLDQWNNNPQLKAVVYRGHGKKAFCAGGDVKSLYDAKVNEKVPGAAAALGDSFFRTEFTLDYRTAVMKPVQISIWDGIVMGGGVGLSIHSPFRIATENSMFAMPEAKIGFFTDVSGGYFLSRLPNHLGVYLGLTSARITGKDLVRAGVANYFIASEKIEAFLAELYAVKDGSHLQKHSIKSLVEKYSDTVSGPIDNLELIDK
jgi:enoyl-CoA hydratase/carnithine racemase